MDWNDIRLLIEIDRAGSFAGAAAVLNVNHATIIRHVGRLEQMAGVRLFRRSPIGTTLTAEGKQALQRALRVEDEVHEFVRALRDPRRVVSVQASEGVASYLLMPLIARESLGPLGVAAQRVSLDLPLLRTVPFPSPEPCDIRLMWSTPETAPGGRPTDRVRKLASIRFRPFAALDHPVLATPVRFDGLAGHKLITMAQYDWFKTEKSLNAWHGLVTNATMPVVTTHWTSAMGHLTAAGKGISLLPTYTTMYTDVLKPLDVAAPSMVSDLWIVAGEEELRDPFVRRAYDGLFKVFAAAEWG